MESRLSAYEGPLEAGEHSTEAPQARPLEVVVAGGALAVATLAAILAVAYKTWIAGEIETNTGTLICGLLFFVYAAGVYVFSYGWTRGDTARAVRLTTVIVAVSAATLLALVLVAALLKTKAGGRGAGKAGSGMRLNVAGLSRALGSYVRGGEVVLADPFLEDAEEPADAPAQLVVTCESCGERYFPLPPRALCPKCGWAAVTVA